MDEISEPEIKIANVESIENIIGQENQVEDNRLLTENHSGVKSVKSSQRRSSADFIDHPEGNQPPAKSPMYDSRSVHAQKPKRVPKSPKSINNIPSYRSVIFPSGKESFSMAECDTAPLDAVKEIGTVGKKGAALSIQAPSLAKNSQPSSKLSP